MEINISIIVPVYNVKKYLCRCVNSIKNQSYPNFEILLIDDGSTDGSSLLCDELCLTDPRIKTYHKENGGLSDARNHGIRYAKGKFYLFIDSDDMIHKKFCESLMEIQKKYNADIVSSDIKEFYSDDELEHQNNTSENIKTNVYYGKEILSQYFNPKNNDPIDHGLCMKLYKKELFYGLRFEVGRLHEDLYITYKLLDRCNCFAKIKAPYYFYYQGNDNSITKNYGENNFIDEYEAIMEIMEYFSMDNEIKNDLYDFIIGHSVYLLKRVVYLPKSEELKIRSKKLRILIENNIKACPSIHLIEKISVIIGSRYTHIYFLIKFFLNLFTSVQKRKS